MIFGIVPEWAKPRNESEERRKRAIQLYRQGVSTTVIAKRLNVTPRTVRRWIVRAEEAEHGGR
ncbi:MAG: helix-turn-helix domain-containing protein [Atopobiaceae bacterium]|nr:helix-turn-helix domain-containing protein [Atopobiaceae bacterium]